MAGTLLGRSLILSTPLGDDVLLIQRMTVNEELGRLFRMDLTLVSEHPDLNLEDLIAQNVTIRVEPQQGAQRLFNGFISGFSQVGMTGQLHAYQATVQPWLWFLTRNADCRIFQNQTVPDIVKQVFRDRGFTDFEERLSGSYRQWEYCVQYRETDFNFVSRLLEQEGIYYYFKHQSDKHTLVLSDSVSAHARSAGYEQIPYFPPEQHLLRERDHIYDWRISHALQSGAYALNDYDFERPKASLKTRSVVQRPHPQADFEIYDAPGEYLQSADGETYARTRIEELQAQYQRLQGEGNALGLAVGNLFELSNYPREDQNREYLLVAATYVLESSAYETLPAVETGELFKCSFTCIPSDQQYRPPRTTPRPIVQGPQTAVVTGKVGEEIWTDQHGRVKVQFHWDRYGKNDENSSCWMRVSQVHAGKGFGGIDIPRIGEEVIISCLEGDPDRPIITGRVYNGDNKPPNGLPAAAMVSGLKSNSTPGGGGDNAIMLDDTKGKEKVAIHGQYNMDTTVGNDQSNTIGNNRTTNVKVDDTETVGSNQTITVGADQKIKIGGSRNESVTGTETITITGHRTETVNGGETVTVDGGRSHTVSGVQTTTVSVAEVHSVGAGRMHNVGAGEAITVGGAQMVNVGGAQMVSVGGIQKVNVGALQSVSVGGPHKLSAAVISVTSKGPIKIKAGAITMIEAPTIVLKAGGSKIIMNSSGVTIKGAKITIKADGNASIKAGGSIKIKGSNIGED